MEKEIFVYFNFDLKLKIEYNFVIRFLIWNEKTNFKKYLSFD